MNIFQIIRKYLHFMTINMIELIIFYKLK